MTASIWQRTDDLPRAGVDALVIGGGIAGVSAALELQRAGRSVLLVEKHTLGSGATGRNAGYLMRGLAESYAKAAAIYGREAAADVWRFTELNLALLRAEGVAGVPGFRDRPSALAALDAEEAALLDESHAMLAEDGFESVLLTAPPRDADSLWRRGVVVAALVNPGDAVCHPVRTLLALAAKLSPGTVAERAEVVSITPRGRAATVVTSRGVVEAGAVLVAVNGYARHLPLVPAGAVAMRRGQMLCGTPIEPSARLDFAYYANHGNEYFRQIDDGRVIMGGMRRFEPPADEAMPEGTDAGVQSRLRAFIEDILGPLRDVQAWSGPMGFTARGLPLAGRVGDSPVWFCGGFTGHGMSMGFVTARAVAREMLGGPRELPAAILPPAAPHGERA